MKALAGITWLYILNFIVLQWFGVRLARCLDESGKQTGWLVLRYVWPLTGWWSPYRWIARVTARLLMSQGGCDMQVVFVDNGAGGTASTAEVYAADLAFDQGGHVVKSRFGICCHERCAPECRSEVRRG